MAAFLVFCLASGHALFGLDPLRGPGQYIHELWQTEQGLPQDTVQALLQTRDGYLWVGTQEGLARFDGARFVVYDKSNTPELRHDWVQALLEDRDGSLWIGTYGDGLLRLKEGRFTRITKREGLADDQVSALASDGLGGIWAGTPRGLCRISAGKISVWSSRDGLSGDPVQSLASGPGGSIWIGTGGGIDRWSDGRLAPVLRVPAAEGGVRAILEDRSGDLWAGSYGGGLRRLRGGEWTIYSAKDGLTGSRVLSLARDRDGNLWVGTEGGGLDRFREGRFSAFTTREGLSNNVVLSLLEDREGSLWAGSIVGLDRLRDGPVEAWTAREGLSHDVAFTVAADPGGGVWIGTDGGGLDHWNDGRFRVLTTRDGLANDHVWSILPGRDGSLWIGTLGGGLDRLRAGRFTHYTAREGLSNEVIFALLEGRDGAIWIGTNGGGLDRLRQGRITAWTSRDGLAGDVVYAILQDRAGALWIGTSGGLSRLEGGRFTAFGASEGLTEPRVISLHEDAGGVLWAGTAGGGIGRLKDGRFRFCAPRDGLPDGVVLGILEDGLGSFWLSSNKGILRVQKSELEAFLDGRLPKVRCETLGVADGMKSPECNGGNQPSCARTPDGRLWFPTLRGVAAVDPARPARNTVAPPVLLEEIVVDGRALGPAEARRLRPGHEKFEFRYTATSLRVPGRVRFRYKLEGYDRSWVDAGTRRTAYYTRIPHGRYVFRVRAANDDGLWNEQGAALPFDVEPFFTQTPFFFILCGAALAGTLAGGHRLRVRQLHARQRELERTVESKTRELLEAEERISRLLGTSPGVEGRMPSWTKAVSEEIARTIGAERIEIWEVDQETVSPLSASSRHAPSLESLRRLASGSGAEREETAGETLFAVTGISGELCGALVVSGRSVDWSPTEQRLIASFTHQLGGALEMNRMRRQLAAAEERRAATRREMQERGIATLQVCPACGRCYDHRETRCAADGSRLESPRALPFRLLERYRFVQLLGQGGMGLVFSARDERLDREVAIKLIRPEHFHSPDVRRRFEREALTVAHIQHPGVVALYDSGELEDGTAFLVMERLTGCDLGDLLRAHGRGSPRQVAELLRQGGAAIGAAHRAGVVHRDLKPENLFLASDPSGFRVKVLDFGVAKSLAFDPGLTQTGMLVGTPTYMSPEQVQGGLVDARSDIYSFAAVCYEALTGERAVPPGSLGKTLFHVFNTVPDPVSSRLAGASRELDQAFESALAKDPGRRPAEIEPWCAAVARMLEAMPAAPQEAGWPGEPSARPASARSPLTLTPTFRFPKGDA